MAAWPEFLAGHDLAPCLRDGLEQQERATVCHLDTLTIDDDALGRDVDREAVGPRSWCPRDGWDIEEGKILILNPLEQLIRRRAELGLYFINFNPDAAR